MEKREEVQTLMYKFGAIELSRSYIRGIRSALSNIRNGIELNNSMLAAKDVSLLAENLSKLEVLFGIEDAKKQIKNLEQTKK